MFKETKIRDSIGILIHSAKDDFKMATCHVKRDTWRLCTGSYFFFTHTQFPQPSFFASPTCSTAIINDICSCNDHLIEVKKSDFFGALFFKPALYFFGCAVFFCLFLMLDCLVKYERDKRNFVRYNYNGCRLFIVKELVTF